MTLPDIVTIKLGIYTLACRELLNRLFKLYNATQVDLLLDYETCLKRFDYALGRFFNHSSAKDMDQATEQIGHLLHTEAALFRNSNENAALIFDEVVTAVHGKAQSWNPQTDLEQFHAQGRDMARRFFRDSPWPETQERLGRECRLIIEYGQPAYDDRTLMVKEPFGYPLAPVAYHEKYVDGEEESEDVVLARFTFSSNFVLYLAYPFLFLHEYTGHIYAIDDDNERFNDGWMLHAAAAFLAREWNRASEEFDFNWAQVDVFQERLCGLLNPVAKRTCLFLSKLEAVLSAQLPNRFKEMTYELAAFIPRGGEKHLWPTEFINALEYEFMTDWRRLLEKIKTSADLRELMRVLSPV